MDSAQLYPSTLAVTLLLGVVMLLLPRRAAVLPIVIAASFLPPDQRLIVATLDFPMIRILILFGALRVFSRGETGQLRPNSLDSIVLVHALILVVAGTLLERSFGGFIHRLGDAFDVLGMYFYCRVAIRSWADFRVGVLGVFGCMGLLATFMMVEFATGRNLFSAIGDVPAQTVIREGRLRCQGAFAHPIMAGLFGATWAPLLAVLWWRGNRALAIAGVSCCLLVTFFASSSTPLLALVMGLAAMGLWYLRRDLRAIRWGILVLLVLLHLVREKPVWHLLARINVVGGSTGYHRYLVIDRAIEKFGEWWAVGTKEVGTWNIHWNDITNQYVAAGVDGGLLAMLSLVGILAVGFRLVGRIAGSSQLGLFERRFAWALGCVLFAHAAAFFAVTYFGQLVFIWYLQLAMIGSLAQVALTRRKRRRARRPSRVAPESSPGPVPESSLSPTRPLRISDLCRPAAWRRARGGAR